MIRSPEGIELRICRMLVPEISAADDALWYRIATDRTTNRVIGAAGVRQDLTQLPRWIVDVHVIPPFRRQGVGRQLIETVASEAATKRIGILDAWVLPEEGSDLVHQVERFGFDVHKKIFEYEASTLDVLASAERLYQRVVERGSIPSTARLVCLKDANMAEVIALHTAYLGGTEAGLAPRLRGFGAIPCDPYLSLVLLVDDRVMGLALCHCPSDPKLYEYDSAVIHPSLRNSWASAWLRYEQSRRAVGQGCEMVRYMTFDQKLGARHSGARTPSRLIHTTCWMRRRVL
jgi:GNAT superfamily N-acetyltransferase